jgi:hypothetical protein
MIGYFVAQFSWVILLSIPVACITWTITREEVFRRTREYCQRMQGRAKYRLVRRFYYMFTSPYFFSHLVAFAFLWLTHFRLLEPDWRGLIIMGFALVWVANIHMALFDLLLRNLKNDKTE